MINLNINAFLTKKKFTQHFMNIMTLKILTLFLFAFITFTQESNAQGDGPRAWMLGPKNMFGIDAKWLNLKQNIVPSGSIFIPEADLKVNVFPTTLFYTFSLGGRFAMIQANITPGNVTGTVDLSKYGLSAQQSISNSGLADGMFSFRIGLIGAPALNIGQFLKKKPGFSMLGMFRTWYSGTYESSVNVSDPSNLINMGTNRWTFEVGLPMIVPFGGGKMPFWWETVPSVEFYTTNTDPSITSFGATETSQQPLLNWENHITKNFSPKFWAGIDFRLQLGGASIVDDSVRSDTKLNIFGGGVSMGYQVLPFLSLKGSYDEVIWGYNGAESRMFRLGATFTYVNVKNLK